MHFLPDIYVQCDVCGGKSYGNDRCINFDYVFGAFNRLRASSAAGIGFAELHIYNLDSGKPAVNTPDEFGRILQQQEFYAFFFSVSNLFRSCR